MDSHRGAWHHPLMRHLALLPLLLLAACADPGRLGITGPGETPMPTAGQPTEPKPAANQFAPSLGPTTGSGKFWGYN